MYRAGASTDCSLSLKRTFITELECRLFEDNAALFGDNGDICPERSEEICTTAATMACSLGQWTAEVSEAREGLAGRSGGREMVWRC